MDGFQILGRHDVFVVDGELLTCLEVGHLIPSPADLGAGTTVGRRVHFMQAEVAFTRYGHAEGAVAEHLDTHEFPTGAPHVVAHDCIMDGTHLVEVQFAGEHHNIGILRVEFHRVDVRYALLGRDMHLHPTAAGIENRRYIAGDYR